MTTRREIVKAGAGLAAIIAAGKAPAAFVRSLVAARNTLIMGRGGKLSAKSYVQNGLVAMWDGIENAGWGVHDAAATTWVDLAGGLDLSLKGSAAFLDNCMITNDYKSGATSSNAISSIGHIEIVFDIDLYNASWASMLDDVNGSWLWASPTALGDTMEVLFKYSYPDVPAANCTLSINAVNNVAYSNGSLITAPTYPSDDPGVGEFAIFGNIDNIGEDACAKGKCYCTRLYSRALTAAEVAANYAVDKTRFNLPDAT